MGDADLPWLAPEKRSGLGRRLLAWFSRHARLLPWRQQRSAYQIWVSEVMLQQTQVATVIPYFERFCRAFPDLPALARADEQEVLRLWEGLGYYRRARNLLRAARIVMAEHDGAVPRDPAVLTRLPGLGRYTTNAILSQAYDLPLPIVETNSRRVLCRLGGVRDDPRGPAVDKSLWRWAELLLPRRRAGDFNQALMEVGALICTPQKPACGRCPLRTFCTAHRLGLAEQIPTKPAGPVVENVRELALLLRRGRKVLLCQRPATGRWENMWEFPHVVWSADQAVEHAAEHLLKELGMTAVIENEWLVVRHGVTRFRIELACWTALYQRGRFRPGLYAAARWVEPDELDDFPLSTPQRRLARRLTTFPVSRSQHPTQARSFCR